PPLSLHSFPTRRSSDLFAKDGFGFAGKMLRTTPGGSAKLSVKRINIAERLYRVTGASIYADSLLTGAKAPIEEPVLNGQVIGSEDRKSTRLNSSHVAIS